MIDFLDWLRILSEDREELIPPEILQGYEAEFQAAIKRLMLQARDPNQQQQIQAMLDCPIRDTRGQCRRFAEYILSALAKNGVHRQWDIDAALQYIVEKMLMDRSLVTGERKPSLFTGFDPHQGEDLRGGLQARFMNFLKYALNNIVKGRIPRLGLGRKPGTVSIGQDGWEKGDKGGLPDSTIPAPISSDSELAELIDDVNTLLRHKEAEIGLPLVDLFQAIMNGERTAQQLRRFGDRPTKEMRAIIKQVVQDYAEQSGNERLAQMLKRFQGFRSNQPMPASRAVPKPPRQYMDPKEKDFRSIVAVLEKLQRSVGSADLGKYRRRWLNYSPRDPQSGFKNRLAEVLHAMVEEGVLKATRTRQGATVYEPGPNYDQYRQAA